MAGEEILKAVIPFLQGADLAKCMLVSKQLWQDIAGDDCLWRSVCLKEWPSISASHQSQENTTFLQLFRKCYQSSHVRNKQLSPPKLSFHDLEFYIDVERRYPPSRPKQPLLSIYSEIVPGATLLQGIPNPPPGVCLATKIHLQSPKFKMAVPVEPRFTAAGYDTVCVAVRRRDSDKFARLMSSEFSDVDRTECRALARDGSTVTCPSYPFVPGIPRWVSLLYMHNGRLDKPWDTISRSKEWFDVFGIELDFYCCDFLKSEQQVLWFMDMLDWK